MPIDFTKPAVTDNYSTAFVPNLVNSISALGMMLDPTTAGTITSPPTGCKRLNTTTGAMEQFNGTVWVAIPVNGVNISGTNVGIGLSSPGFKLDVLGSFNVAGGNITLNPASFNVTLSPTGTGTVTIAPAAAGALNNVAIGGTTPLAGAFTTLAASGNVSVNGQTANGVGYLNASKVLTAGSALTFSGTNLVGSGNFTAAGVIPSGATVPVNGMFLPATNSVGFSTATTERMRIDATGQVGIGNTPAFKLDVTGTIRANIAEGLRITNDSGFLSIYNTAGSTQTGTLQGVTGSGVTLAAVGALALNFNTNAVTRLAISSSGVAAFSGAVATTPATAITSSTAFTLNCAASNVFVLNMTAAVLAAGWTISNPVDGQTINLFINQSATPFTLGWPSSFKWPSASAPTISSTASAVDLLVATYRASTGFWYCSLVKALG